MRSVACQSGQHAVRVVPKGKLVWSGRRLHLSTQGSGDTAGAVTTTTGQSVNPSSGTARGNEAEATPNPVLEVLEDQTSAGSVAGDEGEVDNDSGPSRLSASIVFAGECSNIASRVVLLYAAYGRENRRRKDMRYPKTKELIYKGHGKPPRGAIVLRPMTPPA